MRGVLAGLLLSLCLGCSGEKRGEQFRIYHLETAIGRPGNDGELHCGPPRVVCTGVVQQPPARAFRYQVRAAPAVTNEAIVRSTVRRGTDPATGTPLVMVDLTSHGRRVARRLRGG